jgi:hypothetical protein
VLPHAVLTLAVVLHDLVTQLPDVVGAAQQYSNLATIHRDNRRQMFERETGGQLAIKVDSPVFRAMT